MCLQNDCVVGREGNKLEDDGTYDGITLQYVSDWDSVIGNENSHFVTNSMYGKYGVGSHDHHCTNQSFIQITELEKCFRVAP